MITNQLLRRLRSRGWVSLTASTDLKAAVIHVARGLGDIVPARRGAMAEIFSPRTSEGARGASLSGRFGLGPLPFHCDTAHWLVPCRYVVLACQATGTVRSPTLLLDTRELHLSGSERALASSAVFCVRSGRRSFYASILDATRPFLRIDPGCMEPIGEDAVEAIKLFSRERERTTALAFDWAAGDILVIDNWRVLHGRGNEAEADIGRTLVRAYVR